MSSRFSLEGRCAIVSGAASGLGRAIAVGLAEEGCRVACLDIDDSGNHGTAELIGTDASVHRVDVSDRTAVDLVVTTLARQWGKVDIAVNCAGVAGRSPALDHPDELWEAVLAVNVVGTFNLCRAVAVPMLANGSGSIVNIASIGGLVGYPGSVGYQTSKGGVVQMTRALAMEWAGQGVRVNAVAPSQFETTMVRELWAKDPQVKADFEAKTPMGRIGQPSEIVGPVVFLASDAAAMVTGHILAVDGGYLAQ